MGAKQLLFEDEATPARFCAVVEQLSRAVKITFGHIEMP